MTNRTWDEVRDASETAVTELAQVARLAPGKLLVVGASSSEVTGARIGTAGSLEVAAALVDGIRKAASQSGFSLAFQCCEHLNRALVVERETLAVWRLTEVSAVPIPGAGGAVAHTAWGRMESPVLVEAVQADAGIDIGETLIGMHLRPVAVPVRLSVRFVGQARVTAAYARPRLVGGARAVYEWPSPPKSCD